MTLADLISLTRVPLGLSFVFFALTPAQGTLVVLAAALSDVIDGPVARRLVRKGGAKNHHGQWLDPLCDKMFFTAVAAGLLYRDLVAVPWLGLLLTREILQAIAMGVYPWLRHRQAPYQYAADPWGKATTVLQTAGLILVLWGAPGAWALAAAASLSGAVAVFGYVRRFFRRQAEG